MSDRPRRPPPQRVNKDINNDDTAPYSRLLSRLSQGLSIVMAWPMFILLSYKNVSMRITRQMFLYDQYVLWLTLVGKNDYELSL